MTQEGDQEPQRPAALEQRISELEDAVAEVLEVLDGLKKSISRLETKVATKKQVKKLKKVLDQLEVIEVGPEDAAADQSSPSGN